MLSTWALLMIAVVTEIAWGCSLKALSYYSLDRIFALVPIALTCANMYLLARVMKTLPSGLTYADVCRLDNTRSCWRSDSRGFPVQ